MGFLIRFASAFAIFMGVIVPGLSIFGAEFYQAASFFPLVTATTTFLNYVSPYFLACKGAINYFLAAGLGNSAIMAFNGLIKIGLLLPSFMLSLRLYVSIRNYLI